MNLKLTYVSSFCVNVGALSCLYTENFGSSV